MNYGTLEYLLFTIVTVLLILLLGLIFSLYSMRKKHQLTLARVKNEIGVLKEKYREAQNRIKKLEGKKQSTSYITEQIHKVKQLEEEILRQKDRVQDAKLIAQEANRVKYDFFTNINNEIRTPINSIIEFTKLLSQELKEKKLLTYSGSIIQSGYKLSNIFDDIIELSKLEKGEFEVNSGAVDLNGIFEYVLEEYKDLAIKKGLQLSLEVDEELPITLMLDAEKVKDILHNLVSNALKFTQSGYVKVRVKAQKLHVETNSIDIAIYVEDSGKGIDKQKQEQIFKIFEKQGLDEGLESEGTGLGLSINKRVATLINATLGVESRVNEGSCFIFTLYDVEIVLMDANDEEALLNVDFSLVSPDGAKVLVIDEEEESCETIRDAFHESRVEVLSYNHPRDAIEMLKSHKVDLIFIDIDMFSVDESALSKVIARISKAPIVTLTQTGVRNILFDKGGARVIGHLKKPISKVELFKLSVKELNDSHVK